MSDSSDICACCHATFLFIGLICSIIVVFGAATHNRTRKDQVEVNSTSTSTSDLNETTAISELNENESDWNNSNFTTVTIFHHIKDKVVNYHEARQVCKHLHPQSDILNFEEESEWINFKKELRDYLNSTRTIWLKKETNPKSTFWANKSDLIANYKDCKYLKYSLKEDKPVLFSINCNNKYEIICMRRFNWYMKPDNVL